MKFSVKYMPTALFSLKDSNSTNSGAKSLFLPSPYSIKMAILNQAITIGGDLKDFCQGKQSQLFPYIRDARISFFIVESSYFAVSNSFVKILKPAREGVGFGQTVAFREYLYISKPLEMIFECNTKEQKDYLQKYLHNVNYFGKRGCFFQFLEYSDNPSEANVKPFQINSDLSGILQEYDEFDEKTTFENVSNYSSKSTIRNKVILALPLQNISASKSFTIYKSF